MKSDEIANCVDAYMQASGIFGRVLTSNHRIVVPSGVSKRVSARKMRRHLASRKDLLDGARLEIRLASTQDQSTLQTPPEGVPVNFTCN